MKKTHNENNDRMVFVLINGIYAVAESGFSSAKDIALARSYADKLLDALNYSTTEMLKFAGVSDLKKFSEDFWAYRQSKDADPYETYLKNQYKRLRNATPDNPPEDFTAKENSEGES